jgi:hypothetical protein
MDSTNLTEHDPMRLLLKFFMFPTSYLLFGKRF